MTVQQFVQQLAAISLPNVFNPYRDICSVYDHGRSPAIRRANLTAFLAAVVERDHLTVWLGRDLGYRGGRRTGIALTDEFHMAMLGHTFGITGLVQATNAKIPLQERTATEVWKLLRHISTPVLLWNVFPFHPFEDDDHFSNRRHTTREFETCEDILVSLFNWLKPQTVVALGADARMRVRRLGFTCESVRHPSYGGQTQFAREIQQIYDCESVTPRMAAARI